MFFLYNAKSSENSIFIFINSAKLFLRYILRSECIILHLIHDFTVYFKFDLRIIFQDLIIHLRIINLTKKIKK